MHVRADRRRRGAGPSAGRPRCFPLARDSGKHVMLGAIDAAERGVAPPARDTRLRARGPLQAKSRASSTAGSTWCSCSARSDSLGGVGRLRARDHVRGLAGAAARRPLISAPASRGSGAKKNSDKQADRRDREVGGREVGRRRARRGRGTSSVACSSSAPKPTPNESESCWPTLDSVVARLMCGGSISAYASVFRLVNCSERKKPPTSRIADDQRVRRRRPEEARRHAMETAQTAVFDEQHACGSRARAGSAPR